jgi:hypothetical protein
MKRNFFCSEFIMTLLKQSDPNSFTGSPENTLPIDLPEIFNRAGWTVRKMSDLHVSPKSVPRSFKLDDKSDILKEFLKKHPDLAGMLEQLEQPDDLHKRIQETLRTGAQKTIESEALQLDAARQVKALLREVNNYYQILMPEMVAAKDHDEMRVALNTAGFRIDMRDMPPIIDWLVNILRDRSSGHNVVLEELEGMEGALADLTKIQLIVQSVRVMFLLDDIERVTDQFADGGKELQGATDVESRELLVKKVEQQYEELKALLASHPYLVGIDEEFEAMFEQKLGVCADAIRETKAELAMQDTFKRAVSLFGLLQRTRMVFPVAQFYRALAGESVLLSTEHVVGPDINRV